MAYTHTSTFKASDEQGRDYTLLAIVQRIDAGTLEDPEATVAGMRRIVTEDRRPVSYLGKGKYRLAISGKVLLSSDPDAP